MVWLVHMILLTLTQYVNTDSDQTFRQFKLNTQNRVKRIAQKMGSAYSNFLNTQTQSCSKPLTLECEGTGQRECIDQFPAPKDCLNQQAYMADQLGISLAKGIRKNQLCEESRKFICASNSISGELKSINEVRDEDYGRTYIGTKTGVLLSYPAMKIDCDLNDFRKDEWFTKAIESRKNIVFLFSIHSLMGQNINKAKEIIKNVVSQLNYRDYYSVIGFEENSIMVHNKSLATEYSYQKLNEQLQKITLSQKQSLNLTKAFQKAFQEVIENNIQSNTCNQQSENILIFISMEPQSLKNQDQQQILTEFVNQKKNQASFKFIFLLFSSSTSQFITETFLRTFSCDFQGIIEKVSQNDGRQSQVLIKKIQFFTDQIELCSPVWTGPYDDLYGFKEKLTVSMAVYFEYNGLRHLLGVAAIDIDEHQLDEYLQELDDQKNNIAPLLTNQIVGQNKIISQCALNYQRPTSSKCSISCPSNNYTFSHDLCELEKQDSFTMEIFKDAIDTSQWICCGITLLQFIGIIVGVACFVIISIIVGLCIHWNCRKNDPSYIKNKVSKISKNDAKSNEIKGTVQHMETNQKVL